MTASFLVDRLIIEAVKQGNLRIEDPGGRKLIDPVDGRPARDAGLDAHGYVLQARHVCSWHQNKDQNEKWIDLKTMGKFTFRPKELIIIETYERLSLASNICATVHALARLTLLGLSHISTTVHPGWGKDNPQPLRIALFNLSNLKIDIHDKEPIARILFYESETEARIGAPTADEVFGRSDNALKQHKAAATYQTRLVRWTFIILTTALLLTFVSFFASGFSMIELLKAVAVALVGLWLSFIFRKMTE